MRNSRQAYGQDLALAVFAYLQQKLVIRYLHYGYCGTGFVLQKNEILYTHFDEWDTYLSGLTYNPGGEYRGIIKSFSCGDDFVNWLAVQSDDSLSGKESNDSWYTNNQRITKERLEYLLNDKTPC